MCVGCRRLSQADAKNKADGTDPVFTHFQHPSMIWVTYCAYGNRNPMTRTITSFRLWAPG
jgi:hypothetical protein